MWVLAPVTSAVAALACHALWRRVVRKGTAVSSFGLWAAGWGGVAAYRLYIEYGVTPPTAAALLLYGLACEMYMFLFTLVTHSVSATLLAALRNGPRSVGDIERLFCQERMVQKRKLQMLQTGLLEGSPPAYRVTGKGKLLLNAFDRLHRFFLPHTAVN